MNMLEGQVRIPSGCAISAVIDRDGGRIPGNAPAGSAGLSLQERLSQLGYACEKKKHTEECAQ